MYASNTEQQRRAQVQALADQLYRERYPYLLRIATKHAPNHADAEEAVQFAFLAFVEHFDPDSGAPPLAWLTTTLKRECWVRYRRQRLDRSVGQETAIDTEGRGFSADSIPSGYTGPAQFLERVQEARVKLAALKPAERRTLSLIAAGYSYAEVGEITGFSYTKINRCAAEGRARLRDLAAA